MYERPIYTLPGPQFGLATRSLMTLCFLLCAAGIAPFVLIGILIGWLSMPLMAVGAWWSKPRSHRRRARPASQPQSQFQSQSQTQAAPASEGRTTPRRMNSQSSGHRFSPAASVYSMSTKGSSLKESINANANANTNANANGTSQRAPEGVMGAEEVSQAQAFATASRANGQGEKAFWRRT